MTAGMEVVEIAGQGLEPLEVVGHHLPGEGAQVLFGGRGIHGVGGMGDELDEAVLVGQLTEGGNIVRVDRLGPSAARIAREEGESVSFELEGFLPHSQEAFGHREMAADM